MVVANNISALNIINMSKKHNSSLLKSIEKLSSGFRINKSADDAAGLAISEKMKSQVRGLKMSQSNTQDAISLVQTAEGALGEMHSILQRMRELSVQAANGTNTDMDRENINSEVQELKDEINRISEYTNFNTIQLLNGNLGENGIPRSDDKKEVEVPSPKPMAKSTSLNSPDRRKEHIDFSTVIDGSVIIIDNVSFEFDVDGIINDPNAVKVDIKGLADNEKGDAFALEFQNSIIDSTYRLMVLSTGIGSSSSSNAILDIRRRTATGGFIDISYKESPLVIPKKVIIESDMGLGKLVFQTGPSEGNTISLTIENMSTKSLGINNVTVATSNEASSAITSIDNAIKTISSSRANLGAIQNRLEHTLNNLSMSEENLTASNSRILDCDMAEEMIKFVKDNVLLKSSNIILAQANNVPQNVIKLLQI